MMKQKTNRSARPLTVRLLCAMLCALLAAGILAGCGKKTSDTPKPSGTASATVTDAPTDTEPADSSDDLDDSYHFDRDFIILSRESTAGEFDSTSAISGDDVANAIYSRNAQVEARADVTIKVEKLNSANGRRRKQGIPAAATRNSKVASAPMRSRARAPMT